MKISKESLLYKEVKSGFSVLGYDTFMRVFNDEKQKANVKDYLVSTMWRIYWYIHDGNESIKEELKRMDLKDKHIDTMLFTICKELGYIM